MTMFKVGDRVVYSVSGGLNPVYSLAGAGGRVVKIDGAGLYIQWDHGECLRHNPRYILPEVPKDDPLPPAPESELYLNEAGNKYLRVSRGPDGVHLGITNRDLLGWKVARISPESALALAHDLTRMAMHIKREQRAAEQN